MNYQDFPPCPACGSETYQRIVIGPLDKTVVGCDDCMRFVDVNDLELEGIEL